MQVNLPKKHYTSMHKTAKIKSMKSSKLSFNFSNLPELLVMLKIEAKRQNTTEKAIIVKALKAYFADKFENNLLLAAAEKTFKEWEREEDSA